MKPNLVRWLTILLCAPLLAVRGHDMKFASGRSALCIPFDHSNRHIAFSGRINGRDGMRVVLDTGAGGSVLDAGRADSFGLTRSGQLSAQGSGGIEQGTFVHGVDIALPGFTLVDQTMSALPLASLAAQTGKRLDAILGHPVFARCVVEVDYERQCVSLFDASKYRYEGKGVSVPLSLIDRTPYVSARVVLPDGRSIEGKFIIDTGASSSVILDPGTVEREGVLGSLSKTMTVQAHGVGGATAIRLARLAKLELGGFSLTEPVAALQPSGAGRISAEGTVGNIGGDVLSRFKVIFDYAHRRMILEPGPGLAVPFEADMSGLGLTAMPPDFQRVSVARVLDGSPAFEAGIQPGDEIETVNDKPAAEIGVSALREQLRKDGQDLRLTLLRGGDRITRGLKTRRLI